MRRTSRKFAAALVLGTIMTSGCAHDSVYRVSSCSVGAAADEFSFVVFRNAVGAMRTITFADRNREFVLKNTRLEGIFKGILSWDDVVVAVHLRKIDPGDAVQFLTLRVREKNGRHKSFDYGVIDPACLNLLRARYSDYLKFETF
jgi:hypothetical protein